MTVDKSSIQAKRQPSRFQQIQRTWPIEGWGMEQVKSCTQKPQENSNLQTVMLWIGKEDFFFIFYFLSNELGSELFTEI